MNYSFILFLRLLLKIFYVFPIAEDKIFYTSYGGGKFTCNPKYIYKYIVNQEKGYQHVWVLEDDENSELNNHSNTEIVKKNSLSFIYHFLTAKIVISNASIPTYLPLRKSQKYIETWHGGGAYKRTGLSYDRSEDQIKKLKIVADEVNDFISSSSIFTETKSKNHLVNEEKFFEIGMPRNDVLFTGSETLSNKVKDFYGLEKNTRIVLYAPTYRSKSDDSETYEDLDMTKLMEALENKFGGNWVVFTRMHYYLNEKIQYENAVNVSAYADMQELMLAADVLITDYSSVMWDFSITKKPAFTFAPDLAEYEKNRSFFTPPEKWPFTISENNTELINEISIFNQEEHDERIKKHHKIQGSFEKGNATEQVYEKIVAYTK